MNTHVGSLKPFGIPEGMDPHEWRKSVEERLNELMDSAMSLITALDIMDADSEDLEDGADAEPWLGWGERGPRCMVSWQADCRASPHDDRELEDEHGGDINDEPQAGSSGGTWDGDDEPSLGWTDYGSRTGNLGCCASEPDLEENGDEKDTSEAWDEPVGMPTGDGSGRVIAEKLLEKARSLPSGDIVRECSLTIVAPEIAIANWYGIPPTDPDALDLRAHYWAAKGF